MNGVLSFIIGAEARPFISAVRNAQDATTGFTRKVLDLTGVTALFASAIGTLKGGANIVEGVFNAFERGAELERLSRRTGESVRDLFTLQRGFQTVGVDAEGLGHMLFHLNKSLSGISEMGESTAATFGLLGLNMAKLRNESAPKQMQEIAAAMQKLGTSQRAAVAGQLFGREGAQNFLQIAGSAKLFAQALEEASPAAQQMQRNAAAFERIKVALGTLKFRTQDFFAGIAEGAAPGVQAVLNAINKIDLSGIGKQLGAIFAGFAGAIKEGKLTEALSETFTAAFKIGFNMDWLFAKFARLGTFLIDNVFAPPINFLATGMAWLIDAARGKGRTWAQESKAEQAAIAAAGFTAYRKEIEDAIHTSETSAKGTRSKTWDNFIAAMDRFSKALPPAAQVAADQKKSSGAGLFDKNAFDATRLEKMGFHFGAGGPTILADHAKATADHTKECARLLGVIVQMGTPSNLTKGYGFSAYDPFSNTTI